MSAFSMAKFGSAGVILRSRGGDTLDLDTIRYRAPSVFAEEKHASRSEKYTFLPTYELLQAMLNEGFFPTEVRQGGSRDEEKRGFTKHLIRFRPQGVQAVVGDTFPEIAVVNSHDGTSSYQILPAWFRFTCANGMYVSEVSGQPFKVNHRGKADDVIEASYKVIAEFPKQAEQIQEFKRLQLTGPEQQAFAESAIPLRWEDGVQPYQVLRTRRAEDNDASLWHTFNRVQENITTGGIRVESYTPERGRSVRRSRPVNSVSENIKVNQALWMLTEKMVALKAA